MSLLCAIKMLEINNQKLLLKIYYIHFNYYMQQFTLESVKVKNSQGVNGMFRLIITTFMGDYTIGKILEDSPMYKEMQLQFAFQCKCIAMYPLQGMRYTLLYFSTNFTPVFVVEWIE